MTEINSNETETKGTVTTLFNILPKQLRIAVALIILLVSAGLFWYVYFENNIKEDEKIEQKDLKKPKVEDKSTKSGVVLDTIKPNGESKVYGNQYESNDNSKQVNVDENKGTINVN